MSPIKKNMLISIGLLSVLGCGVSFVFFDEALGIVYGILIGTALSVYRLFSLEKSIDKTLDMEISRAKDYARLKYMLRFFVTAAVLVPVAMSHPTINLFGAFYGIAIMQLSAFICGFLMARKDIEDIKAKKADEELDEIVENSDNQEKIGEELNEIVENPTNNQEKIGEEEEFNKKIVEKSGDGY